MPKEPDLRNIPLHKSPEDAAKVQSPVAEVSCGELARSVASLVNAGEDRVQQLGTGVYVGQGLPPFLPSWPIRSQQANMWRWRNCYQRCGLERKANRDLNVAARGGPPTYLVLRGICKHTQDAIPRDGFQAHGLHGYHHQNKQRVHGFGVEQVQHAISEARGVKKGDQVVGDQPHHLCEMFYRSH